MKFTKNGAEIFIPDGTPGEQALRRTTHMAISAHHDDIEIMAYHGIAECFGKKDSWFSGVVVTDGAGSPRDNLYADYSDEDMKRIRKIEQKKAAYVGEYGSMMLLNYSSAETKDSGNSQVRDELRDIIALAQPKVIYTHNLADKHDTHVAVAIRVIGAIRALPPAARPERLYGCEVWRALDWINDDEKVMFDVSGHPNIAAAVLGVHDSQICGGKRYDLATEGRRRANATYAQSHGTDDISACTYAMDLTPLVQNDSLDIKNFILGYVERFKEDIMKKLDRLL